MNCLCLIVCLAFSKWEPDQICKFRPHVKCKDKGVWRKVSDSSCGQQKWELCGSAAPDDPFKSCYFPVLDFFYLFSGCQRWARFLQSLSQRWCWHCNPHLGPTSPAWSLSCSPRLWQHLEYLGWGQMPWDEWYSAPGNAWKVFFKLKTLLAPGMCFYSRRRIFPSELQPLVSNIAAMTSKLKSLAGVQ